MDVVGKELQTNQFEGIIFLPHVYQDMITRCLIQKPIEACGLLSGTKNMAITHWPMINVLQSPNHFQMDEKQIEDVFSQIQEKGERLVGIYHSHPTSIAYPSGGDIIHASYPEAIYVIVSLLKMTPEVSCFHISKGLVTSIPCMVN